MVEKGKVRILFKKKYFIEDKQRNTFELCFIYAIVRAPPGGGFSVKNEMLLLNSC